MKSKFFKDTQGLGECYTQCPPGQICICLRMDEAAYGQLLREAGQLGITSGEYIQLLLAWHGGSLPSGPSSKAAAHRCPDPILMQRTENLPPCDEPPSLF